MSSDTDRMRRLGMKAGAKGEMTLDCRTLGISPKEAAAIVLNNSTHWITSASADESTNRLLVRYSGCTARRVKLILLKHLEEYALPV